MRVKYNDNIFGATRSDTFYEIYINDIKSPSEHIDDICLLRHASEQDTIYMYINGPGGYVDTGLQIINAMQSSRAKIVTVLDGAAKSMCANIFLAGNELMVQPYSMLMLHDMLHSFMYEKGASVIQQAVDSYNHVFEQLVHDYLEGFLDEAELGQLKNGVDLYFHGEEIVERINRRYDMYVERQAELEATLDAEQTKAVVKKRVSKKKVTKKTTTSKRG